MFQGCFKKFQLCFKDDFGVSRGSFKDVLTVLQEMSKEHSKLFQGRLEYVSRKV